MRARYALPNASPLPAQSSCNATAAYNGGAGRAVYTFETQGENTLELKKQHDLQRCFNSNTKNDTFSRGHHTMILYRQTPFSLQRKTNKTRTDFNITWVHWLSAGRAGGIIRLPPGMAPPILVRLPYTS